MRRKKSDKYKLLITGGGSAGHIIPNLTLIPKLKEGGWEVYYAGSRNQRECNLITKEVTDYWPIVAGKLRRYLSLRNITDAFKFLIGCFQSFVLIGKCRPDIVFAKGSYISLPVGLAAWLRGVPLVIHESDITPGLANRILARFAKVICITFEETSRCFGNCGDKVRLTGLPIRQKLMHGDPKEGYRICQFNKATSIILVMGGGMGSARLNAVVEAALPKLVEAFQIVHLTGLNRSPHPRKCGRYLQIGFADEIQHLMAMADLVISRAGATSIIELLINKKLNILIPLPKGTSRGEQIQNANYCKMNGASFVISQEELSPDTLLHGISHVFENKDEYFEALNRVHVEDGTSRICSILAHTAWFGSKPRPN